MVVTRVPVSAGRIALPQLDQRVRHGPAVLVEHAARDDDALAQRLAGVLPREVVVDLADRQVAVDGRGEIGEARGTWISGCAGARRTVDL